MTRLYLSRTNRMPNLKFAREYVIFVFVYPAFYLFSTFSYDKFNFVVAFLSLRLDDTFYQNNNSHLCLSLMKQVYYLFFTTHLTSEKLASVSVFILKQVYFSFNDISYQKN